MLGFIALFLVGLIIVYNYAPLEHFEDSPLKKRVPIYGM
jgi:hypothetical protein